MQKHGIDFHSEKLKISRDEKVREKRDSENLIASSFLNLYGGVLLQLNLLFKLYNSNIVNKKKKGKLYKSSNYSQHVEM